MTNRISRRTFVGGLAAAVGYVGAAPGFDVFAQGRAGQAAAGGRGWTTAEQYDLMAKLASNENNFGIPSSVMRAMEGAFKYAGRYGYPEPGLIDALAAQDGLKPENILLTAGSGEVLTVVGTTLLSGGKKVLGFEPTYSTVYQQASGLKTEAIKLPLTKDYRQDIGMMIDAAKKHQSEIGLAYLCNPNNPTGMIVTKDEIKQLVEGLPQGMPILIDEAYHHYVDDPRYAPSMHYVTEGRPVIVARTFSKIVALAAMRIGYAAASPEMIQRMRVYAANSVNVIARYGAYASLQDKPAMEAAKRKTIAGRDKTTAQLKALGYDVIPSQSNFFMVGLRREVQPVIQAFAQEGVLVGRPFPPMTQHLRVSVGVPEEMDRFMTAFKKIMQPSSATAAGKAAGQ